MIRAELTSHPLTPSRAVNSIVATMQRGPQIIALSFVVSGQISLLVLPTQQAPSRADELWQHTCFELFARSKNASAYTEFNFSPSTQWAAYRFSAYREGMTREELHRAPTVNVWKTEDLLHFTVQLDARDLPSPVAELAVTAVIEEKSGAKSYWAIRHRTDKPDFHYGHGFVLNLT